MHPILSERRALVAYLVASLAASLLPASVVAAPGSARFLLALAAAAPPTALLGVAALPVYYLCRAVPLQPSSLGNALRVHAALGLLGGVALWVLLAVGARLLDWLHPAGLATRWSGGGPRS